MSSTTFPSQHHHRIPPDSPPTPPELVSPSSSTYSSVPPSSSSASDHAHYSQQQHQYSSWPSRKPSTAVAPSYRFSYDHQAVSPPPLPMSSYDHHHHFTHRGTTNLSIRTSTTADDYGDYDDDDDDDDERRSSRRSSSDAARGGSGKDPLGAVATRTASHPRQSYHHQYPQSATVAVAPRPQLPSLSSLFPPGQRTLPSPMSERPPLPGYVGGSGGGGGAAASSSLDVAPRSAGGYLERAASSSSYFPSQIARPPPPPPVLYEPARPQPASSSSSSTTARAPALPGSQPHRSDRWSFHQDMIRGASSSSEYSYGGREPPAAAAPPPALRLPPQQHYARYEPAPLAGRKHDHEGYPSSSRHYRTGSSASSQQQQQSQQSGLPPNGETVPTKDGLGPKIWTGTHFLPRFVRAAEIPGEGLCYFYDDGTHCKTVIDGEAVNAHWGVTKAGKPRKRLAIACVTCREKKIKCDPDYPRCVQCDKFGRVCKFKNAPRGGGHNNNNSSITSPTSPSGERDEYARPRQSPSVSPRTTTTISSSSVPPLAPAGPPKRIKFEGGDYLHSHHHQRPSDYQAAPLPPPPPQPQHLHQYERSRDNLVFRPQQWRTA